jgi:nitrate/nitrite transport system substrate-binding protein
LAAVKLLTQNRYVDTPAATLATAMTGTLQYTADQPPVPLADFNVFYRYAATFPWRSHAVLTIAQMYRWGQLAEALDIQAVAEQVYRPELYRQAAGALGLPYPIIDYKPEGVHATAWTLTEATQPIEMGPDLCLAGLRYTPNALMRYLKSLASFKGRSFIVASE